MKVIAFGLLAIITISNISVLPDYVSLGLITSVYLPSLIAAYVSFRNLVHCLTLTPTILTNKNYINKVILLNGSKVFISISLSNTKNEKP